MLPLDSPGCVKHVVVSFARGLFVVLLLRCVALQSCLWCVALQSLLVVCCSVLSSVDLKRLCCTGLLFVWGHVVFAVLLSHWAPFKGQSSMHTHVHGLIVAVATVALQGAAVVVPTACSDVVRPIFARTQFVTCIA